jgi:vacuolar-type H+-ATPase subunit E/Vma4
MEETAGKESLLEGIIAKAEADARFIRENSEQTVRQKLEQAQKEAARIKKESNDSVEKQIMQQRKTSESSLAMERHRSVLRRQERVISQVITELNRRFAEALKTKDYLRLLKEWLVEGALSLGEAELTVNGSHADLALLDDKLMKEAGSEAEAETGLKVHYTKSSDKALPDQGIIVTALNGRKLYDGRIKTHIMRYDSEIRDVVYKKLTAGGNA